MHELSIALSIIDVASEHAARQSGSVSAVHVRIGKLSGVVPAVLISAYELAREGSSLEQTDLVVEEIAAVGHCPACVAEREPESVQDLRCRECGSVLTEIVRGRELEVTALEIQP